VTTLNLRNHRKILVVDGETAFQPAVINIRHGNVLAINPRAPFTNLHFRVEGPLVMQLQEAFATDWTFTTGEMIEGGIWFPELKECGNIVARVITDGPIRIFETVRWALLAALAEAHTSVQISHTRIFCRIMRSSPR